MLADSGPGQQRAGPYAYIVEGNTSSSLPGKQSSSHSPMLAREMGQGDYHNESNKLCKDTARTQTCHLFATCSLDRSNVDSCIAIHRVALIVTHALAPNPPFQNTTSHTQTRVMESDKPQKECVNVTWRRS
jgi:hypothetical protein